MRQWIHLSSPSSFGKVSNTIKMCRAIVEAATLDLSRFILSLEPAYVRGMRGPRELLNSGRLSQSLSCLLR
jgi:hypothetical protein